MINVLIVDDELEIRKGLHLKVDWQELGFHIVAEAVNGADALEKLSQLTEQEKQAIDVVITDMNMPVMDGVGLLSQMQQHYPGIKAVVLTGYDDFAYTKAAIRHRAVEYLLKPVMPDELEQTLLQLKQAIMSERQEKLMHQESSRRHQRWFREIRENFALHMLKGDCSPIIMSKAANIEMKEWETATIQVVTVGLQSGKAGQVEKAEKVHNDDSAHNPGKAGNAEKVDNINKAENAGQTAKTGNMQKDNIAEQTEQFQLPFELITRELAEQYADQLLICKDSSYPHLIHLICRDGAELRPQMIEKYHQQLKPYLNFELVLGVSGEANGFQHWHRAYMDALLQWSLLGSGRHQETALQGHISRFDDEMLMRLLQKDELNPALQYISTIFTEASARSHTELVRRIFEVLIALERLLQAQQQTAQLAHSLWLNPEQVLKLTTVAKAIAYVEQYLQQSHSSIRQESNEDIFDEVLAYIGQNYAYEITLPSLAEKFNYNTSYFSELFKSKVGQTFVQYVSEIRMKHACRLLETTELGLSDIAELTGFSNASYFSSRFKKIFNISPSEYRSEK